MALRETTVESGKLRGIACGNPIYTAFKGIPYARPPVGGLRWKAPQPAESWSGIRAADHFSPIAPQSRAPKGSLYQKEFFQYSEPMSEDCLYLNIWTPAESVDEKLPVLFWIYGGEFTGGYSFEPEFDGEGFCRRGIILVTVNYRLGALGFMAHPELAEENEHHASGNYGHLDQIAALKWVRRNIHAFGGDPENITLCGQSAGAMSVQVLLCSPLSKGDFAHAILQSGGGIWLAGEQLCSEQNDAEQVGISFMEKIGSPSIEDLGAVPWEEIVNAQTFDLRFTTAVYHYVLPENTAKILLKGEYADVPYLIGNCSKELSFPFKPDRQQFEKKAREAYGIHTDQYLAMMSDEDDMNRAAGMADSMFVANRVFAELLEAQGRSPAYLYYFDRQLPGGDGLGAFHSAELWYEFQTLSRCWRPFAGADYDLSNTIADYWSNFVKNGNPNGQGLPQWNPFTKEAPESMELGLEIGMKAIPENKVQAFQKKFILGKL